MGRPWEANSGPGADELRRLVALGHTDVEIGEMHGVTRQTVQYWRKKAGVSRGRGPNQSHKDEMPWTIVSVDHEDGIAKRLREYSTMKKGKKPVTAETKRRVENFVATLAKEDSVIDYDPVEGFGLRKRNPAIDAPDDIIRRPKQ